VPYRFEGFTLDPRSRRLLRDDEEVHLSPKAFDLLVFLVENRERAVPRSELHAMLWPSTFVLETNLAGLVAEVRRALDDSADAPRFVRTMHRVGYRFIGDVADEVARPAPAQPPRRSRYWLIWETRQIPLDEGENILGRAPEAPVWIDAAGVSRHHARIVVTGESATVEDLGSKNGTFVRGQRVTAPYALVDGDQIRLGSIVVTFRIPPPATSTETVPSR
jgi:DNA-binding winged helix-turn-helix (wHTH) protein